MRLPSLTHMSKLAVSTARRFKIELLTAVVGVVSTMRVIFLQDWGWLSTDEGHVLGRVIMSCVLVMNVSLALTITFEAKKITWWTRWVLLAFLGSALTWFVFALSGAEWDVQKYMAAVLSVHAAVALSAIWNRTRRGFWEFNKSIFLRVLTGMLFTGVLILGINLALVSLHELFEVQIDGWMYGWTVSFFIGIFNTFFVLGGIPATPTTKVVQANTDEQTTDSYPRGLRIFTQFVLLPLVVVFLCILYAYGIKVLFFADLNGNVSAFILLLSIVGTLAFLLVYPLRNDAEHTWIAIYARWFGRIMIPLSMMLWVAIIVRVDAYGITEGRYAVIALASCLTLISLYLAVLRDPDLRVIPIILAVASLVAFVGPFNMTSVSYKSQTARANALLEQYRIVVNRQIDTVASSHVTKEDAATLRSIAYYLHSYEDSSRIQFWLAEINDDVPRSYYGDSVMAWLGIPDVGHYLEREGSREVKLYIDHALPPMNHWVNAGSVQPFLINESVSDTTNRSFTFYDDGAWVVRFPVDTMLHWVITDPSGAKDTIGFRNAFTDANDFRGPVLQQSSVTRVAEFPYRVVTFAFDSFDATLLKNSWKHIDARGNIIIERK